MYSIKENIKNISKGEILYTILQMKLTQKLRWCFVLSFLHIWPLSFCSWKGIVTSDVRIITYMKFGAIGLVHTKGDFIKETKKKFCLQGKYTTKKKLKEHDQHHLWYVGTLRSSC